MAQNKTAGIFDIRNVIGLLLAVYGVILLLLGIFGDKHYDRTGDVNANLWAGIILLLVGIVFLLWGWLRPVEVDEEVVEQARHEAQEHPHP
jgi:protein-S-isoprenylcysteine O-methyltransferase Ste14